MFSATHSPVPHAFASIAPHRRHPQPRCNRGDSLIPARLPPPPCSQDDFLSKILHTVSSQAVKEPPSYSLSDEQLQKITQLKPPEQKPAAPAAAPAVTLWDAQSRSRISGAAAPNPKEMEAFLRSHPHVKVYANQDTATAHPPARPEPATHPVPVRVAVWDALKNRKLTGAEAPTEKELAGFLQRNPHCEIYSGQRPAPPPAAELGSEPPLKPSFKWVDKPLAGKWEEPVKPRALDAAPQPVAPTKRPAELPPPTSAAAPGAAPVKRPRVDPVAAPAAAAAGVTPTGPDAAGIVFVPICVSNFPAVRDKLAAYMSSAAMRRSLACLAHPTSASVEPLNMPMPFLPFNSMSSQRPPSTTPAPAAAPSPAPAAAPAPPPTAAPAPAPAADDSDKLLASLLDAAGGSGGDGNEGGLCISSLFDDSECAALGAVLHSQASGPRANQHARPVGAAPPPGRAASRSSGMRTPSAAAPPHGAGCAPPMRGPSAIVPLSSYTSGDCGYPYCENKGWFAFNEAGKGIFLLERLFWMLSLPNQPLSKHPGRRMRDAIRWMDRATADAHGVPPGCAGFELVDANIFSDEVYPQWRSGSFRKTAKHWGLTSPKPKQHSVRKLTPKCMYLPVLDEADQPAVDVDAAFKALPATSSLQALHEYVRTHIRPLEEAIKAKAAASTPRSAAESDAAAQFAEVLAAPQPPPPPPPPPPAAPTPSARSSSGGGASHAGASNDASGGSNLTWHCNTLL